MGELIHNADRCTQIQNSGYRGTSRLGGRKMKYMEVWQALRISGIHRKLWVYEAFKLFLVSHGLQNVHVFPI